MANPPPPPPFTITPARTPAHIASAVTLFSAYAHSLPIDLSFQNFRAELDRLPGAYAPPRGEILLAYLNSTPSLNSDPDATFPTTGNEPDAQPAPGPVGVIALRPLASILGCCEMKRLYVTPAGRGLGVGRALVERVLEAAVERGYAEVRLDTLGSMGAARALYGSLGFGEVERYYETPIEGTTFLGRALRGWVMKKGES